MTIARLPQSDYEDRWTRVQSEAKKRDLDGLVVWARTGIAADSRADVFYLSNHHSWLQISPDFDPVWVDRSQSAIVLPLDGEPTLVNDVPDWRRDLVAVNDVRFSLHIARTVAEVLVERGLSDSRIGFVGEYLIPLTTYRRLVAAAPGVQFEGADDLIEDLRVVKSARELEFQRASIALASEVVDRIMRKALHPGTTEAEAVAAGLEVAIKGEMAPLGTSVASGPHSYLYAYGQFPFWSTRVLEEGDMFHVSYSGMLAGYLCDPGRSGVVGGRPNKEQRAILDAAAESVDAGVAAVRAGTRASEVFTVIDKFLRDREMSEAEAEANLSVESLSRPSLADSYPAYGHGIGLTWGWPFISPHDERELQAGMCIGVETMPGRPGVGAAFVEDNMIVTESGVELLTTIPKYYA
jgi:Xaa-Pro dipeptidase